MAADLPYIPVARSTAHSATYHGVTIEDPYAWLRDPGYPQVNDPDVLGYLNAENAYFEAAMKPHRELVDTLFAEMKGRVKDDDRSVPQKDGAFVYWNAFDPGAEYRKWYRRPATGGSEAVILDEPALAEGHEYFRLGGQAISPDGRLLAYAADTNGAERFVLKVRELEAGVDLADLIENWRYGLVWAEDSRS
jgi:oligopeptidase B